MDLKYLNTFRTIVEEGSFSRAAERLNYTQSTITFQMGQLEGELSAQLFEKVGRRMRHQPGWPAAAALCGPGAGRGGPDALFPGGPLTQCRGEITIGVAETLLCYRLPPVLKAFHRQAPGARLFLRFHELLRHSGRPAGRGIGRGALLPGDRGAGGSS